mmetsp:Transcript_6866/g.14296  ORF Transcript_6866/g.14296 Transcript_6866/m.14296 type:complete len:289 (-) Transcript_6866:660-1526(-)
MLLADAVTPDWESFKPFLASFRICSFCGRSASSMSCLSLPESFVPPIPDTSGGPDCRPRTSVREISAHRILRPATLTLQYLRSAKARSADSRMDARVALLCKICTGTLRARLPQAKAALSLTVQAVSAWTLCVNISRRKPMSSYFEEVLEELFLAASNSEPIPFQKAADTQSMVRDIITGSYFNPESSFVAPSFKLDSMVRKNSGANISYIKRPCVQSNLSASSAWEAFVSASSRSRRPVRADTRYNRFSGLERFIDFVGASPCTIKMRQRPEKRRELVTIEESIESC